MRRLFAVTVLFAVVPVVCAQIYKWKDAAGTTHYSETPPASGAHYSKMTVSGAVADPAASAPAAAASTATAAPAPAPTDEVLPDTPANRARVCAQLKQNLAALQAAGPVNLDDGKGHVAPLNADQRQAELNSAQTKYNQYCGS